MERWQKNWPRIYDQELWPRIMTKNYDQELWPRILTKIGLHPISKEQSITQKYTKIPFIRATNSFRHFGRQVCCLPAVAIIFQLWILCHWKTLWKLTLSKEKRSGNTTNHDSHCHSYALFPSGAWTWTTPLAWTWTTMPIQFFHTFTWGLKALHAAHRNISPLPELSEWTLM